MIFKIYLSRKTVLHVFITGFICFALTLLLMNRGNALADEVNTLNVSDMQVRISSKGSVATFKLYNTVAAKEFYNQLPLKLELSNFRDAQWIFYPLERLSVTADEAYHEGRKGELSYYEPWGDVFMLYKDFYAGDAMHRLGVALTGSDKIAFMSGSVLIEKNELKTGTPETPKNMFIKINANGQTIVFELNNSRAARELYAQLPLKIKVEDYAGKEKIFYPPEKLNTSQTPNADAQNGTLAYYAPWGDVVMFYKQFGSASGLFELGKSVSGIEHIPNISGVIQIEKK